MTCVRSGKRGFAVIGDIFLTVDVALFGVRFILDLRAGIKREQRVMIKK